MLREKTGVERHDIALVMGSGWLPAVDALGEATAELELDGPARLRAAGRGRARGQDPVGARRRPEPAGVPRPHPLLRGPRRARRGARGAHGGGGRVPRRGADQRLRRPEGDLAARHAGADQRPHQPDRHVTDRGRQLRRPHRPLQPAAARAVPLRRRVPRRGRLRPAARAALRDAGRDRHGPRASAATWSACRPRSRRSRPARRAWRCSASPWSPTSPRASPARPLNHEEVLAAGRAAASRMGELLGAIVPQI